MTKKILYIVLIALILLNGIIFVNASSLKGKLENSNSITIDENVLYPTKDTLKQVRKYDKNIQHLGGYDFPTRKIMNYSEPKRTFELVNDDIVKMEEVTVMYYDEIFPVNNKRLMISDKGEYYLVNIPMSPIIDKHQQENVKVKYFKLVEDYNEGNSFKDKGILIDTLNEDRQKTLIS